MKLEQWDCMERFHLNLLILNVTVVPKCYM